MDCPENEYTIQQSQAKEQCFQDLTDHVLLNFQVSNRSIYLGVLYNRLK